MAEEFVVGDYVTYKPLDCALPYNGRIVAVAEHEYAISTGLNPRKQHIEWVLKRLVKKA